LQSYELLLTQFDRQTAAQLAPAGSPEEIQRQIDWLPHRKPGKNPLGLLRQAIAGDWAEPPAVHDEKEQAAARRHREQKAVKQAEADARADRLRQERKNRRLTLERHWQSLTQAAQRKYLQRAVEQATGTVVKGRLRRLSNLKNPPHQVLDVLASDLLLR
jgi:hypothetical protein